MKGKILLVTLYGNFNYGNVLQRYSIAHTLEGYGFEVTHLCIEDNYSLARQIKGKLKLPVKYILALMGVRKFRMQFQAKIPRKKRFKAFQDGFMVRKMRPPFIPSFGSVIRMNKSEWEKYCCAVTGSDQVWNVWDHTSVRAAYYYLEFMPREKRVCYAPSFGFSQFPEHDTELHRKGLLGFDRLSCREQEMQPMIRALTGQEAELVLDPTLLLSPEQWREVASKPEYPVPERYVLCYFLGKITPEYQQAISDMAGGLPVINIHDMDDITHYVTHPGEFVYLIDYADFVVTDSFHGTAFSVNFGKNFLAFRRREKGMEDMFGRIDSLLSNVGITNHVYASGMSERPAEVDYSTAGVKLDKLRASSMKYLAEVLRVSADDIITGNKNTQKGLDKMENRIIIDTTRHDTTRHDTTRHDTTRP